MSQHVIPPMLRYHVNAVTPPDLPARMGRAALRGNRSTYAVAVVGVTVVPLVVASALGAIAQLDLAVAGLCGLFGALVMVALAVTVTVPALWRRIWPVGEIMWAIYDAEHIRYGHGTGPGRIIAVNDIRRARDLETALLIIPRTGRRLLIPADIVPTPIADHLTHLTRPAAMRDAAAHQTHLREIDGLAEFFGAMQHWGGVQLTLAAEGRFTAAAPLYGIPFVRGRRVIIPRGPGNAETSDGFVDYSIRGEDDGRYSLRTTRRDRTQRYPDQPIADFETFADAAQHFIQHHVAAATTALTTTTYSHYNIEESHHG